MPTEADRAAMPPGITLPPTEKLLVAGGDGRIVPDPESGLNRYHCRPCPDPALLAFGSSTASVISEAAFDAAERLRRSLTGRLSTTEPPEAIYADELDRIRRELLRQYRLAQGPDVDIIFAESGTDLHRIMAQLLGPDRKAPLMAVTVAAAETGSGVPDALCGEIAPVALRRANGTLRPAAAIDTEVKHMAEQAVAAGRPVLLVMADLSKSGLVAPSPGCAARLKRRHGDAIEILVDACQARIGPEVLHAYLKQGFTVALTGSKFMTGPTFSGAMLVPAALGERLRHRPLPEALRSCSVRADWPIRWSGADSLGDGTNFGLLLRWEAALTEMRAFHDIDGKRVKIILKDLAGAIRHRLLRSELLEPLPTPAPDRRPIAGHHGWDAMPTIFPFVPHHPDGRPLNLEEARRLHRRLLTDLSGESPFAGEASGIAARRFQLGQPIACGKRRGIPVGALRLCIGARNIVTAASEGTEAVIGQAVSSLDKAELLIGKMEDGRPAAPHQTMGPERERISPIS